MKTYQGSCHCGAVRFEVEGHPGQVVRCNCSFCAKKGGLLLRVPPEQFRLLSGEEQLRLYQFNTHVAKHYFCAQCGIHPYSHPRAAPDWITVNVRCLDDFDTETEPMEIVPFDGRNFEQAVAGLNRGFEKSR